MRVTVNIFNKTPGLSWATFVEFGGLTALELLAQSSFVTVDGSSASIQSDVDASYSAELLGNFTKDVFGNVTGYDIRRVTISHEGEKIQEWRGLNWSKATVDQLTAASDGGDHDAFSRFLHKSDYGFHLLGHHERSSLVMGTSNDDFVKDHRSNPGQGAEIFTYGGNDRIDLTAWTKKSIGYIGAGTGDDTVLGGAGKDYMSGEDGNDLLKGGDSSDNLKGRDGNDRLYGQNGNDRLDGGADDDAIFGGQGNDNLTDIEGTNILSGGAGKDDLTGQGTLSGGAGNDNLNGVGTLSGGAGNDNLNGVGTLSGGAGDDTVWGLGELSGGPGNDKMFVRSDNDYRKYVDDWKTIVNTLDGGAGDDDLQGATNKNVSATLRGGKGDDTLSAYNFNGGDTFDFRLNGDRGFGDDRIKGGTFGGGNGKNQLMFDKGTEIEMRYLSKQEAMLITASQDGHEIGTIKFGGSKYHSPIYRYDFKEMVDTMPDLMVFV